MPYLGIFGLDFEYNVECNIVIFEISALKYVELQSFVNEQKCLNLGPKMHYVGTIRLEL